MKKRLMILLLAASALNAQEREFRAAWIATVFNIDWPSRAGLDKEAQQTELTALFDTLVSLNFNAVILQVKPSSDAFYTSKLSPWSRYLSGIQGQDPGYDPLVFAVQEAHKRGLEVHAWINPFRISSGEKWDALAPQHPARKNPDWVIEYGGRLYFDPGRPEARAHVQNEILEIVRNYDIDALHMDDYFYPYRISNLPFGDGESYQKYGKGKTLDDWRRSNTEIFIQGAAEAVKKEKPYVRLGISPFGVWRNKDKDPRGSDSKAGQTNYDDLYADILAWLDKGWIDDLLPQIYWDFDTKAAPFDTLVSWWSAAAGRKTKIYPGLGAYRLNENWDPEVLKKQISYLRKDSNIGGMAFFSAKWIQKNTKNVHAMFKEVFPSPALIPAYDSRAPRPPKPILDNGVISWKAAEGAWNYAVYGGADEASETLLAVVHEPLSYPVREGWHYRISSLSRRHAESLRASLEEEAAPPPSIKKEGDSEEQKPAVKPAAPAAVLPPQPPQKPAAAKPKTEKPVKPPKPESPRAGRHTYKYK